MKITFGRLAVFAICAGLLAGAARAASRPNIVVFSSDDQRTQENRALITLL